jgi:hypothetical protein
MLMYHCLPHQAFKTGRSRHQLATQKATYQSLPCDVLMLDFHTSMCCGGVLLIGEDRSYNTYVFTHRRKQSLIATAMFFRPRNGISTYFSDEAREIEVIKE